MGSQGTKGPLGRINTKAAPGTLVQLRAALPSCLMRDLLIGHRNVFKARYAKSIPREEGCEEAHQQLSRIKPQLKIQTEDVPWSRGFDMEGR